MCLNVLAWFVCELFCGVVWRVDVVCLRVLARVF